MLNMQNYKVKQIQAAYSVIFSMILPSTLDVLSVYTFPNGVLPRKINLLLRKLRFWSCGYLTVIFLGQNPLLPWSLLSSSSVSLIASHQPLCFLALPINLWRYRKQLLFPIFLWTCTSFQRYFQMVDVPMQLEMCTYLISIEGRTFLSAAGRAVSR